MATWTKTTESLATADNHQLKLTVTETATSAINNTSTLQWTLECIRNSGSDTYVSTAATTITINGIQVYYTPAHGWSEKVFPTCAGSTSGTLVVTHDSNGTKNSMPISFRTRVYYSTVQEYGDNTMNLTALDRTTPTVSLSVGSVTNNSVVLTGSSNVNCNLWEYSINGGSWASFSTTSATSASTTVNGLTANTNYTFTIRARKASNSVYGSSSSVSTKTLGGASLNSVENMTLGAVPASESRSGYNSLSFNVTKNSGTYYTRVSVLNGNNEIFHIDYGTEILNGTNTYILPNDSTGLSRYNSLKNIVTGSGKSLILKVANYTSSSYTTAYGDPMTMNFTLYGDGNIFGPTIAKYSSTVNVRHVETVAAVTSAINDQAVVQNISRPKIKFGTVTKNVTTRANIVSYGIVFGNVSMTFTTMPSDSYVTFTEPLTVTGSYLLTITATDANGFTGSLTERIDIIPYSGLTVVNASGSRVGGTGTSLVLAINGTLSRLTSGSTDYNTISKVYYAYKKTNESVYSSYILAYQNGSASSTLSVSVSNGEYTISSSAWSGSSTFDAGSSYNIKFKIIDALESYDESAVISIGQGTPTLSFSKISGVSSPYIGLRKMSPSFPLDVNGNANFVGPGTIQSPMLVNGLPMFEASSGETAVSSATTSWKYYGSITIPKNCYYILTATSGYSSVAPVGTRVSTTTDPSKFAPAGAVYESGYNISNSNLARVNFCAYTSGSPVTYYLHGKYASAREAAGYVAWVLFLWRYA